MGVQNDSGYDVAITGSLAALNSQLELDPIQKDSHLVVISGTWVGTISFQISADGVSWITATTINLATGGVVSTTTANGNFVMVTAGCKVARVVMTAYTSGSALVTSEGSSFSQYITTIQGPPSTTSNAWPTKITDGSDTATVSSTGDLAVSDGLSNGGVHGALTLTIGGTAYEAKVGASRLANRKNLTITALDDMYWGYDNTVTTATGTPLFKNQSIIFDIDADSTFQVWLVASANNKNARITESV